MAAAADDPAIIVKWLKSLGLTKYEALVYIALLRVTGATATEIHGISGVPRASVYPVLDQLQTKGLVSVSQSSPKRFAALPPDKGIGSLLSRVEKDAKRAQEALCTIHRQRSGTERGEQELIWNVYGIAVIRKKLAGLLARAGNRVRIVAHPRLFSGEIKRILMHRARDISVEIVTFRWDGESPDGMKIFLIDHPQIPKELDHVRDVMTGGVCLIDDRIVMVIMGLGDEDAVALYSESEGFVRFFTRYYALITDWAKKPGS